MKDTQTAAQRLAEAMFVSSVATQIVVQQGAGIDALVAVLADVERELGTTALNTAARVLDRAYDLVCSEIVVEP